MFAWLKKLKPSTGQLGEQLAKQEYKKQGFTIIGSNIFNRKGKQLGEIDFIATKNNQICFVEVKTRSQQIGKFGSGLDAVGFAKQQKLLKAVKLFLNYNKKYQDFQPQIDVCVIELSELDKTLKNVIIISNAVEDIF